MPFLANYNTELTLSSSRTGLTSSGFRGWTTLLLDFAVTAESPNFCLTVDWTAPRNSPPTGDIFSTYCKNYMPFRSWDAAFLQWGHEIPQIGTGNRVCAMFHRKTRKTLTLDPLRARALYRSRRLTSLSGGSAHTETSRMQNYFQRAAHIVSLFVYFLSWDVDTRQDWDSAKFTSSSLRYSQFSIQTMTHFRRSNMQRYFLTVRMPWRKLFWYGAVGRDRFFGLKRNQKGNDWAASPSSPKIQRAVIKRPVGWWCARISTKQVLSELTRRGVDPCWENGQAESRKAPGHPSEQRIWSLSSLLRCIDWKISPSSGASQKRRERWAVWRRVGGGGLADAVCVWISDFNPFTPKSEQLKIPLKPHQEYYITQYEELGFS